MAIAQSQRSYTTRPKNSRMPVEKAVQVMEHDTRQTKVLALGIALLVSVGMIVFSMHDADANPDLGRALRIRDVPASEPSASSSGSEGTGQLSRADGKRVPSHDHR